ncbi:TonB-dependent receptor [Bacterioplanes sanyensis]|uniref:TonB-dependent receptor plug domain-containing protein n=1 Tax=Bacterioplanes sanyensis TaxID=1249553 RepID=UPI0016769C22|nr:TonB-dependent receptor [Bacterioplanes sanyensis]GGY47802.1 TonB-dependent receptor [Bacterioplanes sanyensis]
MKKTLLSSAVAGVFGTTALMALPISAIANEQAAQETIEEVLVTGSSIQRKDLEGSLPVQQFDAAQLEATGALDAAELMTKLPAMQNFVSPGESVGGSGGGLATANIHGLGSSYTLVLINGRRVAPSTSDGTVDISHIPTAMIERVEILTDGASALYGSDAIAGVVNFILKKGVDKTTVSARVDRPTNGGGESQRFDLTTGFGNLFEDGYEVVLGASRVEKDQLAAVDRDFSKTGFITFQPRGHDRKAFFFNGSSNAIPGNAYLITPEGKTERVLNPYRESNGACAENNTPSGSSCQFDYTSTLEAMPEKKTDSVFAGLNFQITDGITAFTDVTWSNREMTSRIAPYPTGAVPIALDSAAYNDSLKPVLTDEEIAKIEAGELAPFGAWRSLPAGNRTTEWKSESLNFTLGAEGYIGSVDFNTAFVYSKVEQEEYYPTGWLLADEFTEAVARGDFNIFVPPSEFSEADQEALSKTIYKGTWGETDTEMMGFNANVAMPLFTMGGGDAQIAAGVDYYSNSYEDMPSQDNKDAVILFLSSESEFDLERDQYGAFTELLLPVVDGAEVTLSARYDVIGGVKSEGKKISDELTDLTYKLSGKYDLTDSFTVRAAYGTGFKAPGLLSIGIPVREFGVTSGNFDCPFEDSDPRTAWCIQQSAGPAQAHVFQGGNTDLEPEKSTQWTAGFVFRTDTDTSATIDYWNVKIEDQIDTLTENQIFDNPEKYSGNFTTKKNLATGFDELAILQEFVNIAESQSAGIDYRIEQGLYPDFGSVTLALSGTHMIKSWSSSYGSNLDEFGSDDQVTFSNKLKLETSVMVGQFNHHVTLNYQGGYRDQTQEVEYVNNDGTLSGEFFDYTGRVPAHQTIDYQGQFLAMEDALKLTFGINNITDKEPPLSLRTSGAGHQVGFDPRYFDVAGRTWYAGVAYSF